MGNFHDTPFKPRTPPKGSNADLEWWSSRLQLPQLTRPIPGPVILHDHSAYSDASSGVGIGVVVGEYWCAWTLVGDWHSEGRDIGWAEAVAFELLACTPSLPSMAQTSTSNATGTTQESSKGGGKGQAKTPKPTQSSEDCTTSSRQPTLISTQSTYPANTTPPTRLHEASLDPQTGFSPQLFSPTLFGPTFKMRQILQLGLEDSILHPNDISSATIDAVMPCSVGTSKQLTRKSSQPQLLGMTSNHLQAMLAKNRAIRRRALSPYPSAPSIHHTPSPECPHCPAKDCLLKWRPLSIRAALPSRENIEESYLLTAGAWEPSTLTSYVLGLLVFHVWGDSKGLPEVECTPVSQDTIASFITDLAGAYVGDTIANYVQGVRAWHRIYDIPWNIDDLHIQTMLKGA